MDCILRIISERIVERSRSLGCSCMKLFEASTLYYTECHRRIKKKCLIYESHCSKARESSSIYTLNPLRAMTGDHHADPVFLASSAYSALISSTSSLLPRNIGDLSWMLVGIRSSDCIALPTQKTKWQDTILARKEKQRCLHVTMHTRPLPVKDWPPASSIRNDMGNTSYITLQTEQIQATSKELRAMVDVLFELCA